MYYTGPSEDFSRPGPHLVPHARQDALPALGRGVDLLPRGRPRPSPADRAGALPRRHAEPLPAHARGHVGPRRGLGALRRAAHGRARLPRRPRVRARHAPRAGDARGARRRRHRHAPRARDPRRRAVPPGRDVDARARAPVRDRAQRSSRADFMASEVDRYLGLPGQAISYKVGERVWLGARDAARQRARRRRSTSRSSTAPRSTSGPWASPSSTPSWRACSVA